ncbi:MAG: efflux RND transporter periplasmic adaptor subunit [Gammaproteobacteria bacterium]
MAITTAPWTGNHKAASFLYRNCGLLLIGALVFSCAAPDSVQGLEIDTETGTSTDTETGTSAGLMQVEIRTIEWAPAYEILRSYWGRVEPHRKAQVSFQIPGKVVAIKVELGDSFEAGTVLAELDAEQAELQVSVATAQLAIAQSNMELAEASLNRLKRVNEAGYSSPEAYDQASKKLSIRHSEYEAANLQLQQAKRHFRDHFLRAPWSGRVQSRMLDEGTVVAQGVPLLYLIEDQHLEVHVGVANHLANRLSVGEKQEVWIDEEQYFAILDYLAPAISLSSQIRDAVFRLDSGSATIGQGAELRISSKVHQSGFWVPIKALRQLRKGLWALAVLEDADGNTAKIGERLAEIIHIDQSRAYVSGTAAEGELLVVSNVSQLATGQQVRFVLADHADAPASNTGIDALPNTLKPLDPVPDQPVRVLGQ